jgi:hypothetical protein
MWKNRPTRRDKRISKAVLKTRRKIKEERNVYFDIRKNLFVAIRAFSVFFKDLLKIISETGRAGKIRITDSVTHQN